jgi:serine/threonine protein phosphatase PrpC
MAMNVRQHLFAGVDTSTPLALDLSEAEAVIYTHRAPGRDSGNEDSLLVLSLPETGAVLAVCDGLGGLPDGETASAQAVQTLAEAAKAAQTNGSLRENLLDGIETANKMILTHGRGSATTLALAEVAGGVARTYHVGDSSVLICGQRGKLKHYTMAHSPVGYAVEAGVLDEEEALHHDERHFISNMLGSAEMRIEIGPPIFLAVHDTLLLASDGLFDNLYPEEIIDIIRCGRLMKAATRLRDTASRRMLNPTEGEPSKWDDMSFILFRQLV